jgi:purine-binding chemotaxis protein CheW
VNDGRTPLVTFALAGEEFAVGLEHVREIVALGPITRVPAVPPFLLGVMNVRGAALPVVDLAQKFGFGAAEPARFACVVVLAVTLRGAPVVLGVLVDEVRRLVDCAPAEIGRVPALGTPVPPVYLLGLGRDGDRFFLVLDAQRVLTEDELMVAATSRDGAAAGETPGAKP